MRTTLYLLVACLFSACSTIEYIGIETYNPAEITFPKKVDKVLIVNNAVPQPDDVGYTYNLYGTVQDTARAHADSALYDACHSLGKSIVDVSFFNDVLLYHDGTRQDTKYLVDEKLTPEAVKELCRETGTDAVISFDRLLFRMEKNVVVFAEGFVVGGVDVEITGVVRGYLPGRDNPLATVYVQDSVFWSESADNMEQLKLYLPSPDEALRAAGQYIGTKITPNFVPHWDNESRWFYKGEGARWKEATAYALSDKWEEAALRWKHVYENSSRWKERAKAASNLALYYEMKTQLKEAYNWAAKSYEIFNSKKGEDYNYTKMQRLYVEALGKRIRSDQKLNKQFGE
ncbi:DUF6340 family protein [Parabacteroides johnsonii]|uniref:DUF6340 family protein n=1 Tax=Parabacteroides johnsonii TaxID=387661 RepID=UPI00265CC38C|nr:DUF6340 family protein [Parabacteroides johnsonii]